MSRTVLFMTIPFLAIYLHQVKGIEPHVIGLVLGGSALFGTLSSIFGGMLSDKVGRFTVMIVSVFVCSDRFPVEFSHMQHP
jgi:MFS family permease